jgi:hypothetical protein
MCDSGVRMHGSQQGDTQGLPQLMSDDPPTHQITGAAIQALGCTSHAEHQIAVHQLSHLSR